MREGIEMTLKAIFKKPVDRPIEGVIKADDEASLRLEIEEYVLTSEIEKRLESFLGAYNNYDGANGAWISGFFGSGKSHLLKILALILENREIDGTTALDLFLPKCGDNEILRGDLKRASSIPSKSILFNIDQKADVISKTQADALLAVFVKVFDEMCGYYGKQGHIARFERDLDSRGLYGKFQSEYRRCAGIPWQKGREQALLEGRNIARAYAAVSGGEEAEASGLLDKYRSQYKVSIEDFAEQVQSYIEKQPSGFRLNFFVDEVGQYIADNVKLMTNLQTIAESLATRCRGRSWIVVTAQEEMGTVVGEMSRQKGNDFSKIQARFNSRMKLTSANVAEVIQSRLLTKNDEGVGVLSDLYQAQSNNFKTLFDFSDGSRLYRNFQDREHFIRSYPFIPYQFDLFQSSIQNLSQHNAFEGKYSSVGERSMLGVFQQVVIRIGCNETGWLATFDLMFEGVRTALKSQIQKAVIQAENNLNDPFAVRLLKALFLVKYVNDFKPTVRNLCVLMLDSFDTNLPALKKRVEEALNLLEHQTYIQRNGEVYSYLTDEEKDVEQEIKNTEVESADVSGELEKIAFDHVLKIGGNKIRYDQNGQDYQFSRKLDDRLYGREYELGVHIVSPFHENAGNESALVMMSMLKDEILVVMPPDDRLIRDLLMYERTEKYIRQNISITQQESLKRILSDKALQNRERFAEIQQRVRRLLGGAKIFLAGSEIELCSEDAQTRVKQGFYELIARAYPHLRMLRGVSYIENDIPKYLAQSKDGLFGTNETPITEAEQEVLSLIRNNAAEGLRTTVKSLLEKFSCKPYGWYYAAVLCTLAHLCARGKVEVRVDGNLLEDSELESALRNTHGHGNVVLEQQIEFTASQVRALKDFYGDFFDAPPRSAEAKALGKETAEAFQELLRKLGLLIHQAERYPFVIALEPVTEKLKECVGKPYSWYLAELPRKEDALLDLKESVIDPISKFMSGHQKGIFDSISEFVGMQEPNFASVPYDEIARVKDVLTDPECFRNGRMQQARTDLETLKKKINDALQDEIEKAKKRVAALEDGLRGTPEFDMLTPDQQKQIEAGFQKVIDEIEGKNLIAVIRDTARQFEESGYKSLLSRMTEWLRRTATPTPGPGGGPEAVPEPAPRIEYVSSHSLVVSFDKPWLADENDVDRYVDSLRTALLAEIRSGKRVQIS